MESLLLTALAFFGGIALLLAFAGALKDKAGEVGNLLAKIILGIVIVAWYSLILFS